MPLQSNLDLSGGAVILILPLNKLSIYQDKPSSQLALILLLLGKVLTPSSGWDFHLIALTIHYQQIILTLQSKLILVQLVFALVLKPVLEASQE